MLKTEWFSGATKPTRSGMYHVESSDGRSILWAYWNNGLRMWGPVSFDKSSSFRYGRFGDTSAIQRKRWRGLTEQGYSDMIWELPTKDVVYEIQIRNRLTGGGWQVLYPNMQEAESNIYWTSTVQAYKNHDVQMFRCVRGVPDQRIVAKKTAKA